jgi:hypothetical protein
MASTGEMVWIVMCDTAVIPGIHEDEVDSVWATEDEAQYRRSAIVNEVRSAWVEGRTLGATDNVAVC